MVWRLVRIAWQRSGWETNGSYQSRYEKHGGYELDRVHYVVIGLFACEQDVLANSVLTPSQQSPQLPCPLASVDSVIDIVSKILVHVFIFTCRFLILNHMPIWWSDFARCSFPVFDESLSSK